jgi:HlyD family secretion protein
LVRIFLLVVVVIVIAVVGLGLAFMPSGDGTSGISFSFSQEKGRVVRVQIVARESLLEFVSAPGEIEPNIKVDVSAEIAARIVHLPFREGEAVSKDDVIIRLDAREFEARLESAEARRDAKSFQLQAEQSSIAGPKASLANARVFLKRQESLFETGDIARQNLDDARNRVSGMIAQVESAQLSISVVESSLAAAEAEIAQAQKGLDRTVMRSPITGVITILNAEIGELVMVGTMNNPGTVIMTIADLTRMRLDARVSEADIARIETHQPAVVRINAYPKEEFEGSVERIALQRSLDRDGSGFFKTEVQLELNGRRIYSGLAANVDIEIANHEGLVVPSQTVLDIKTDDLPMSHLNDPLVDRSRRTQTIVYRVVDGKALMTPVEIGPSNLASTIISKGLAVDDTVIVGPYKALEKLKDGEAVLIDAVDSPAVPEASDSESSGISFKVGHGG